MISSRIRDDPRLARKVLLYLITLSVTAVTVAAVTLTIMALSSSASSSDRLASVGDVLAGATLLLAVVAAGIAALAYAVSTGPPDIRLRVHFEWSSPNSPRFEAEAEDNGWLKAKVFKQTWGRLSLRNDSSYPAKNPAVIVRLNGMAFLPSDAPSNENWIHVNHVNTVGITAIQWDGGPNPIHAHSERVVPSLDFTRLWHIPEWGKPSLSFEILADGYRRMVELPVDFIVKGESKFTPDEGDEKNGEWV